MADPMVRELGSADVPIAADFLERHTLSSMFLRFRLAEHRLAGAIWLGAFDASGAMIGILCRIDDASLAMQVPGDEGLLATMLRRLAERLPGPIGGSFGPSAQVVAARRILGFDDRPTLLDSRQTLYDLPLARLQLPASLVDSPMHVRLAEPSDAHTMIRWRVAYVTELGGMEPSMVRQHAESRITSGIEAGNWFLLIDPTRGHIPVSMSAFNARTPDCVQIGGVFTPRTLRGLGYARAVVAGSLQIAAEQGATRSVLFTAEENLAAQSAYEALGYRAVGTYHLLRYAEPHPTIA